MLKDEVNKDLITKATKAWDNYLAKLDKKTREEIFSDYKKYLKAYAIFINELKLF